LGEGNDVRDENKEEALYDEENLRISISAKHDDDSYVESSEVTHLKNEVETLRARLRELEEQQ
jgi:polyhydroxyalkanoate synthesis regulator phasin